VPAFALRFSSVAKDQLAALGNHKSLEKQHKAVLKTLGLMETNLRHPSLNTHEFEELTKKYGEKIFEAYAENRTPAAFRIFWKYGPGKQELTIVSITDHP
jgi:hypothetical protein